MGFNDLLKMMIEKDGSDLFLKTGALPSMKAFGKLTPLVDKKLPEGTVKKIASQTMNEEQIKNFEKSPEMNLAIAGPDIGRSRVNIFKQRGELAILARNIKTEIPSAASLGVPHLERLNHAEERNCLVRRRSRLRKIYVTGSNDRPSQQE